MKILDGYDYNFETEDEATKGKFDLFKSPDFGNTTELQRNLRKGIKMAKKHRFQQIR